MKLKILIYVIFLCVPFYGHTQDPQFTQFSAIPMHLNPAFTGSTLEYRAALLSRVQWPGVSRPYVTNAISVDYNYRDKKSGFGLLLTSDIAGDQQLRSLKADFLYSYRFTLMSGWRIKPGLSFGIGSKDIDFNSLVFGNQLNLRGNDDTVISDDTFINADGKANYFDFNTGVVMYNQRVWFGLAVFHLNQPNISFGEGEDQLPIRYSAHGGFSFPLYKTLRGGSKIPELAPAFLYQKQGKFDQLDLGLYVYYSAIQFGVWYRGIPIGNSSSFADAVAFLFGYNTDQYGFAYSYDFVTTNLGLRSGGSHELSLSYQFYYSPNKKKRKGDYTDINKIPPFLRQSYKRKH